MSEPIDPVSLEMGGERTCSVVHFQKVQGEKLKAQILSHSCTYYAHFQGLVDIWVMGIYADLFCMVYLY